MTQALGTMHWGDGSQRILLLHGLSSNAAGWWRLGPDLAAGGWSVAAPDLRGHGTSPIAGGYTIAEYAEDVLALGREWDAVLGHSLGGTVAVAAQHADPSFSRGLVLQDPALVIADAAYDDVLAELLDPMEGPASEQEIAAEHPEWHPTDVRIKVEALRQSSSAVVRCTMEQNRPWNLLAEAASLRVPTVVIGSDPEAGGIVPVTIGEWLAAESRWVAYRMIEGAGHSLHRDNTRYPAYLAEVRWALQTIEESR
jgi:pimeloyl-ACP methyl ester carboxylesterase